MATTATLACAVTLLLYGLLGVWSQVRFRLLSGGTSSSPWPKDDLVYAAPRGFLGAAAARASRRPVALGNRRVGHVSFNVLRAAAIPVGATKWQLRIRALILNLANSEMVFDDLHTIVYSRVVPTAPLMTISYHGNAVILQDNTLFKEERAYSILPGDGIEVDILVQVTRYVGAPSWRPMREEAGPLCVVFGLVADFYDLAEVHAGRRATTSDKLLMFMHRSLEEAPLFTPFDQANVGALYWPPAGYEHLAPLTAILEKHRNFRPIPA